MRVKLGSRRQIPLWTHQLLTQALAHAANYPTAIGGRAANLKSSLVSRMNTEPHCDAGAFNYACVTSDKTKIFA